ncbi:hypothetical protein HYPSUDRAFT_894872 [Hypholoma sublateritium FD-334 SS-4]|uniref:Uncharacterized protein n=1 Tax=Hypholoma sublateritium (strain FD-334 SS-4) TaxID=945553 RepID=A0A0D2PGR7_HYPSF|nr:hypothetical protein HYPSUDRAFT_894872 [Hypholoma sublateritium FD-334 SS-4]
MPSSLARRHAGTAKAPPVFSLRCHPSCCALRRPHLCAPSPFLLPLFTDPHSYTANSQRTPCAAPCQPLRHSSPGSSRAPGVWRAAHLRAPFTPLAAPHTPRSRSSLTPSTHRRPATPPRPASEPHESRSSCSSSAASRSASRTIRLIAHIPTRRLVVHLPIGASSSLSHFSPTHRAVCQTRRSRSDPVSPSVCPRPPPCAPPTRFPAAPPPNHAVHAPVDRPEPLLVPARQSLAALVKEVIDTPVHAYTSDQKPRRRLGPLRPLLPPVDP